MKREGGESKRNSLFFFLNYFSKAFSNRILNPLSFDQIKTHRTKTPMHQHVCNNIYLAL